MFCCLLALLLLPLLALLLLPLQARNPTSGMKYLAFKIFWTCTRASPAQSTSACQIDHVYIFSHLNPWHLASRLHNHADVHISQGANHDYQCWHDCDQGDG